MKKSRFTNFFTDRASEGIRSVNLTENILSELISFGIGTAFGIFLFCVKGIRKRIIYYLHVKKLRKSDFIFDEALNIYTIENAVPEYSYIKMIPSSKKLFVNIPDGYRERISKEHEFHYNTSFDGAASFRDLSIQTGIYDLEKLVEIHSAKIATAFEHGYDGCKFNEKKYGVLNVEIGSRKDIEERPYASITTFETDFFTYRVFHSIYKELLSRKHEIIAVDSLEKLIKYNCFICSIGINALLEVDAMKYNKTDLLLTKRSGEVINYRNMYHISANEGLCYMDYNASKGSFSLENCLFRGLQEEIGIPMEHHVKTNTEYSLWDIFISRDTFDFSISAFVRLKGLYYKDIQSFIAKDKAFEINRLTPVKAEEAIIKKFVSEHNFVPQGLFVLNSFFVRRFGHAISIPHKKKD